MCCTHVPVGFPLLFHTRCQNVAIFTREGSSGKRAHFAKVQNGRNWGRAVVQQLGTCLAYRLSQVQSSRASPNRTGGEGKSESCCQYSVGHIIYLNLSWHCFSVCMSSRRTQLLVSGLVIKTRMINTMKEQPMYFPVTLEEMDR